MGTYSTPFRKHTKLLTENPGDLEMPSKSDDNSFSGMLVTILHCCNQAIQYPLEMLKETFCRTSIGPRLQLRPHVYIRGPKSISGTFCYCFPPYDLRQDLSLNVELILDQLSGESPESTCLYPSTGIGGECSMPGF